MNSRTDGSTPRARGTAPEIDMKLSSAATGRHALDPGRAPGSHDHTDSNPLPSCSASRVTVPCSLPNSARRVAGHQATSKHPADGSLRARHHRRVQERPERPGDASATGRLPRTLRFRLVRGVARTPHRLGRVHDGAGACRLSTRGRQVVDLSARVRQQARLDRGQVAPRSR